MLYFNKFLLMKEEDFKKAEKDIEEYMDDNREELFKWAKNCNKFFDPDVYNSQKLFDKATMYLINDNYGKYTDEDIKYLIYYFSKRLFNDLKMDDMRADVSTKTLYTEFAVSSYDYDNKKITFYIDKFGGMKGEDPDLLNGLMLIFREIYRVKQERVIRSNSVNYDINDYIIAMETINSYSTNGFYANNHDKLLRENMANIFAFLGASQYLKYVKPDIKEFSNKSALDVVVDTYNNEINSSSLTVYGAEGKRFEQLDLGCRRILKNNPEFVLKYPILLFGFDVTGKKKDMVELADDYEKLIKLRPNKKEEIDNFYKILMSKRYYLSEDKNTLKNDVKILESYLKHGDVGNKFYYELLDVLDNKYNYIKNSDKYVNKKKKL